MPMTPTRSARRLLAAAILVAVPFGVAACGGDDEKATDTTADRSTTSAPDSTSALAVSDAWARTATAGGNGAVYMMIAGGDAEDALVSATVPADLADRVELHECEHAPRMTRCARGWSSPSSNCTPWPKRTAWLKSRLRQARPSTPSTTTRSARSPRMVSRPDRSCGPSRRAIC